jgi:predicted tellurium resistance membrane protein TerC
MPYQHLVALVQVILIDVALAGDNALVVGLAASQVARENRARGIFWGIVGAVLLCVVFAAVAVDVFAIVGMTLAGGRSLAPVGLLEASSRTSSQRSQCERHA